MLNYQQLRDFRLRQKPWVYARDVAQYMNCDRSFIAHLERGDCKNLTKSRHDRYIEAVKQIKADKEAGTFVKVLTKDEIDQQINRKKKSEENKKKREEERKKKEKAKAKEKAKKKKRARKSLKK